MKKLLLIIILMSMLMLPSCKKDDVIVDPPPSQTEVIANELQKLINDNGIKIVSVYVFNAQNNSWDNEGGCNGFKIENPYIQVCGTYYDLSKLVKFKVQNDLELYFKF